MARPNQFVLGPPVSSADDQKPISPVLIALANVRTPTVLIGKLEYANLEAALRGASTPSGFSLTLKGKFVEQPEIYPLIEGRPGEPVLKEFVTRAATGGADLEIVWGVTKAYASGPDYAVVVATLGGGLATTLLFGLFMAGLIRRNRVINQRVDQATAALRLSTEELTRAHELVRRAFGRYVSEEVAESLLRAPEALELGGHERDATILMSDLRGFTAMAERMSPRAVIEVLNLYLETMVEVIGGYEGTIDEIIGDAILVIFGAPVPCDDHAARAVACGLGMQLAMTDVNHRLAAKHGVQLEMGIGIHSGRVIVGNIGSLRRTKYAAVGSNVNLAGRVESFATGGQVLITDDTCARVAAPLRIDGRFEVEPKGAARRLLLFEIGGIGEPYMLSLPPRSPALRPLAQPLPVQFTVLEEKFVGRTVHDGHLTELSDFETRLRSPRAPALLSNVKITVAPSGQGNPAGEIYGKVVDGSAGSPGLARVRFTSATPELKAWLRRAA
jgi:adenylate cyclase